MESYALKTRGRSEIVELGANMLPIAVMLNIASGLWAEKIHRRPKKHALWMGTSYWCYRKCDSGRFVSCSYQFYCRCHRMNSTRKWTIRVAEHEFTFDELSAQLLDAEGNECELSSLPKSLLLHFLENPQIVINNDQLTRAVWKDKIVTDSAIQKAIRTVRVALGDTAGKFSIKSVHGQGYRFEATVEQRPRQKTVQLNNNGAKMLTEVVSLMSFRSTFASNPPKANLYCDVIFSQGSLGGKSYNAPVRFRLALKRAELYVSNDEANLLKLIPHTLRPETEAMRTSINVQRKRISQSLVIYDLDRGENDYLTGSMWFDSLSTPMIRYRDERLDTTKEPPELSLQICCRHEDLFISDIEFVDEESSDAWGSASPEKRLVVEHYLREELIRRGLEMGDFTEPFSTYVLADSITYEETDV